jgi:uncharacterized protein (TIGR02246 family)
LATSAKDTEGILELVAEDVVFLPSSMPPIKDKEEVGKMYRAFFPRYREIKHEAIIEEIRVAGDWAFLWGTDDLRLTPVSGEPNIHLKGKGLSILKRKSDGSWLFCKGDQQHDSPARNVTRADHYQLMSGKRSFIRLGYKGRVAQGGNGVKKTCAFLLVALSVLLLASAYSVAPDPRILLFEKFNRANNYDEIKPLVSGVLANQLAALSTKPDEMPRPRGH